MKDQQGKRNALALWILLTTRQTRTVGHRRESMSCGLCLIARADLTRRSGRGREEEGK
jgi:hypothetical protein